MRSTLAAIFAGAALFGVAGPALAADLSPSLSLSGSATFASDYRLRGVSRSDNGVAGQASLNLSHNSGLYAGAFASTLGGWGSFGGPGIELDAVGGYRATVGDYGLDCGLTWYFYPGGAAKSSFGELFARISRTIGPVYLLGGIAYAPPQKSLGNWYATPQSRIGAKGDNLYLRGDASAGIPQTPVTLKAHIGWSSGNPGLGPNGFSLAPTGDYADWLIGADVVLGPMTVGIAYVDTNISAQAAAYQRLQPAFNDSRTGGTIAGGRVVFSVSAGF
jgi:uncharacterized protein (TIGR02001 family)